MAVRPRLSGAFLSRLTPLLAAEWESNPELEARLQAVLSSATAAWPAWAVPGPRFLQFLAERLSTGKRPPRLEDLDGPELYLVCACLDGDPRALAAFEQELMPAIDRSLRRLKALQSTARRDEVKQLLRERLLVAAPDRPARLAAFSGRGSLLAWLRIVAVREAYDLLDRERRELVHEPGGLAELPALDDDVELAHMKRTYRAAFRQAFETAFLSLEARDQTLLRQHLVDGLTLAEMERLYRVHLATVARWLTAAREQLNRRTRKQLMSQLDVDRAECDSILRLAGSRLDLSISRVLRKATP